MSVNNLDNTGNASFVGVPESDEKGDDVSELAASLLRAQPDPSNVNLSQRSIQDLQAQKTTALLDLLRQAGCTNDSIQDAKILCSQMPVAHVAAMCDCLDYFVTYSEDERVADEYGRIPFHTAAAYDSFLVIDYFMVKYPNLLTSSELKKDDHPILHAESDEMIRTLLAAECCHENDPKLEIQKLIRSGLTYYSFRSDPFFLEAVLEIGANRKLIPKSLENSNSDLLSRVFELGFSTLDPSDPKIFAPGSFFCLMRHFFPIRDGSPLLHGSIRCRQENLTCEFRQRKLLAHVHSINSTPECEYNFLNVKEEILLQDLLVKVLQRMSSVLKLDSIIFSKLMDAFVARVQILEDKTELNSLVKKIQEGELIIIPGGKGVLHNPH